MRQGIWTKLNAQKPNAVINPEKVRARTYATKSPSQSEALRFIDSANSPSTRLFTVVLSWVVLKIASCTRKITKNSNSAHRSETLMMNNSERRLNLFHNYS